MTVFKLLQKLHDKNIKVAVHNQNLKVDAPQGAMTPEILNLLKCSKQELINYLNDSEVKESHIEVINRTERLKLSFAQQRLWFIDQLDEGSPHYNMHSAMFVQGDFNLQAAQVALFQIIERHEPLRTVFKEINSEPFQFIHPKFEFKINQVDLTHINNPAELESAIESAIDEHSKQPFDLTQDLMLKVNYLKTADQEGYLLFNMHHIASDGWSAVILIKEFIYLYESSLINSTNPLKLLDIQYVDFSYWQRNWLKGDVLERQLQYWEHKLSGLPQVHKLPLDYDRPQYQTFIGARKKFIINESTLDGLKTIARQNNVTLFMVLHTVFCILLSRFSNSSDVIIGTPIANRTKKELEPLIGLFVNTLVLRIDCSDNPAFTELLKQVKNTNLEAQANQDVPFEHLVDKLKPTRSTNHNALFQILFNMDTNEPIKLKLPNVTLKPRNNPKIITKFDLTLSINEAQGLNGYFEYNTGLFSCQTIQQMVDSFSLLLSAVIADPNEKVAELPILNDEQTRYQLDTLNMTDKFYRKDLCVHQLFEQQVKATPDQNAVFMSDIALTYSELNVKANQLAHYLIEQGVEQGQIVGLCLERSFDMLVGLMAILKTGAAYLPMDPSHPSGRLDHVVQNSGLKCVLIQSHLQNLCVNTKKIIIDKPELNNTLSTYSKHNPIIESLNSSHLAYVIYTSGSTGLPKGVMIEHHSVINLANNIKTLDIGTSDKSWGWIAPLAFDSSVKGICMMLYGKPLHIISESEKKDSEAMKQKLLKGTIGILDCTPTLLEFWLNVDLDEYLPNLIIGGEAISVSLWERLVNWQDKYNKKAFNVYGPTECCVDSSATLITGSKPNIGSALDNYQFYILDRNKAILPLGNVGELYIAGCGLARGYLNSDKLNSERFIEHSFDGKLPIRLYKTGDLVRYLNNGHLEFISRIDKQVKIRGYRIELGEIQYQIEKYPDVISSIILIHGENDVARLVAYITIKSSSEHTKVINGLRHTLSNHLPNYMVPSAFVVLDEMPLNSNGKININALPAPENLKDNYSAPTNKTQIALSVIWSKLLNIPVQKISADANFFELGGHSLMTIRLLAEIRSEFSSELSVRTVFEQPQLNQMADLISNSTSNCRVEIKRRKQSEKPLLPSYAQQRLWFINQMDTGSTHYNMPSVFRIDGIFNVDIAEESFIQIIQRHESLRTVFIDTEGGPLQSICEKFDFKINQINMNHLNTKEQATAIELAIENEAVNVFDLSEDLMLRASFIHLGVNQGVLLFNMHHIASDGWSTNILTQEFMQSYLAISNNETSQIQPPNIQYADYAHWQRHWLKEHVFEQQLNYWQKQLASLPQVHSLPLDFKRPQFQTFNGAWHHFKVDKSVTSALKSVASSNQATLFMVIHAIFSVLLSRLVFLSTLWYYVLIVPITQGLKVS